MNNILNTQTNSKEKFQIMNSPKTLMDLNMMDAFLFEAATENVENAKKIAKIIIERSTGRIVDELIVESQKQLKGISLDKRGIRMDIYVTEQDNIKERNPTLRVYDIEPNKYYEKDLPQRSRFYHAMIDSKLLSSNTTFKTLPEVFTIWILPYDPFGDDRMIYTVKNMVVENNKLVYNDGITKIFLYTNGSKGGSQKLKDLLTYLEHTTPVNAVDEDLVAIQQIVGEVKRQKEVGERYMTLQEMIDYEKRDSYNDGLEVGIQALILDNLSANSPKSLIIEKLQKLFQLDLSDAEVYYSRYAK